MNKKYYTDERAVQIILYLLKANGIKKIVASPGTTNITFVGSVQQDPWFEVYSSVDERSAAYIACGLAEQSREPVVLTCTGATASRNYYSGLTEAFYRKLPVLAITSHQGVDCIGHLGAQNIDRRQLPNDIVKLSVEIPFVENEREEFLATIEANRAILELRRNGGGSAHINLYTHYSTNFSVKELPSARVIRRYEYGDDMPELPQGRILITLGSHPKFTEKEVTAIENFCSTYDAAVLCDHSSGYYGKYRAQMALPFCQSLLKSKVRNHDLCINIGEITGDYSMHTNCNDVWRVSRDGDIKDKYGMLSKVFQMSEEQFFSYYAPTSGNKHSYIDECNVEYDAVYASVPDLPFGNLWLAHKLSPRIPSNSVMHFGILNSLRSWNMFKLSEGIETACNVGGFGIDGGLSALIGASLVDKERLCFGAFGDLAFFYDMNSLGNRHVGNNLRILLINNGCGTEFKLRTHPCYAFGENANKYMAAAGHYGSKSGKLVRHYAEDLGFKYLTASDKEGFMNVIDQFVDPAVSQSILLEVFTDCQMEDKAYFMIRHSISDGQGKAKQMIKGAINYILGEDGMNTIHKLVKR